MTVLRSTGLISRNENPFREDPAGPEVPVPDAQLVGPWTFTFAVMPHAGSWEDAGVVEAAESYRLPFVTMPGTAGSAASPVAEAAVPGLTIDGRGVVLSALRRRGSALELRVVALTDTPTEARIGGRPFAAARDVDLLGRPGRELSIDPDGSLSLPLRAWEIRTVRLEPRATSA